LSRIKRPSPALVVAVLALVVAIAVPAYALTKNEKRVVRKIASAQVTKRADSERVVLNDPAPGDPGSKGSSDLLSVRSFTIGAECSDDPDEARLFVQAPDGSSFAGTRSDGTTLQVESGASASVVINISASTVKSGHFTAVAPNGQVLSVSGSAELGDPAGDCVFGATAIAP
jgi:hypothetical protein